MQWVRRTTPWLWTAIAILGPATIAVVNELSKGPAVVTVIGGVTLVGALADNARKRVNDRLRITITIDAPQQPLPANNRTHIVDHWITQQRDTCLEPLYVLQRKAERQLRTMKSQASDPTAEFKPAASAIPDLSSIMASLVSARNTVSGMRAAMGYRPENRAPEDYQREATEYLTAARSTLDDYIVAFYVRSRRGVLRLRPINMTDRTFTAVTFVLRFPSCVTPIDPETIAEPPALPSVPRKFGTAVPGNYLTSVMTSGPFFPTAFEPAVPLESVDIEYTSSGAVVTYPPVTLRAQDHNTALPEVHLLLTPDAEPGSITVQWEATAENAEGRVSRQFHLDIGSDPLVPANFLDGMTDQQSDEN
jgi:hypothetical protein